MGKTLGSYPKVFNLGHRALRGLLDHPVFIEEKVDGSQFSFGVRACKLFCRSRGAEINIDDPPKLFKMAVETARTIQDELICDATYRAEAITSPKHNILTYNHIPDGGLILYDLELHGGDQNYVDRDRLEAEARNLCLMVVPVLWGPGVLLGSITIEFLQEILAERESCLGGPKIEGRVIKSLARNLFGVDGKPLVAKLVSEAFREKHAKDWVPRLPGQSLIIDRITATLRTEARWEKAIQHLRDGQLLVGGPQDIGPLLKEIQQDTESEESVWIADQLFMAFRKVVLKGVCRGFPEWYKARLNAEMLNLKVEDLAPPVGADLMSD